MYKQNYGEEITGGPRFKKGTEISAGYPEKMVMSLVRDLETKLWWGFHSVRTNDCDQWCLR